MLRYNGNGFVIDVNNLGQHVSVVLSHSLEQDKNFHWAGLGD